MPASKLRPAFELLPGLTVSAVIAGAGFALRTLPGVSTFSPMILAIVIGIAVRTVLGSPAWAKPGIVFALRRVLRLAIILLGLQLTLEQVNSVGVQGVALIAATLIATFVFTTWLGRRLGVERGLTELIAAGTSICGASAVIATNTVTGAHDEDVAYAVGCVTVFGSIAMFAYPLLVDLMHLSPQGYGLWAGASIHEIAQVVAAGFQDGREAGEYATIAKLSRVMMLAPVMITLSAMARRKSRRSGEERGHSRAAMPWFVLGFIALVGINSAVALPLELKSTAAVVTTVLLSMALAAMGLETDVRKLRAKGPRPLILGLAAFLFIAGFSLMLVRVTM
ncbi:MAG: YeiH family putative sulfate export transporter [Rhodospirillales bacterium]|nr:YeiH family putative sulfate export transporter [Rhodospirillales bacterium]